MSMNDMSKLAAFLHTLDCRKEHSEDMNDLLKERDPQVCYFYLEETMADCEALEDHVWWNKEAENLCETLDVSPGDLIRIITNLLDLKRRFEDILVKASNVREFALRILSDDFL